jgi:hypothetical protein
MDLPSGTPKRLTGRDDLEFAPAFSADGRRLAFVTWDDNAGGSVWVASFDGDGLGRIQRVTETPGQYANPAFSRDGSKVVFLRGSGASFRDEDLSDELWHEIHWVSPDGGPMHYVIGTKNRGANRRMARPTFSLDGERIYYVEDEDPAKPTESPKTVLAWIKLDGTDRRALLRWEKAEEAAVSPDGRWVAFNELHNAYVTALPEAGSQTVEISLDSSALPLGKLTDEGGEWVGWADGGRTITWIFGPVYHRLAVDKAFPPPESDDKNKEKDKSGGKKEDKDKDKDKEKKKELPKSEAIEITLQLPRAKPGGTVAYTGARLITMKGNEVLERGTIVVKDDRIVAVGEAGSVAVPPGARPSISQAAP